MYVVFPGGHMGWCCHCPQNVADKTPLDFISDMGFARLVEWLHVKGWKVLFWYDGVNLHKEHGKNIYVFYGTGDNIRLALIDCVIQAEGGEK